MPKLIVVPMDDAEKLKQAVDVAKRCASVGRTEVVLLNIGGGGGAAAGRGGGGAACQVDESDITQHINDLQLQGLRARFEQVEHNAAALTPDLIICSCPQLAFGIDTELDHWQATWPGTPTIIC